MAESSALRVRSGLQFVQALRPALYALLVLSALFTFWAGGEIAGRSLPEWTQKAAPASFAVFLVVFAIYRFALVRAKRYPAATGLFQVGLGALIWVLLLPGSRQKFAAPTAAVDDLPALLASPDPRIRSLASELAGYRPGGERYAAELIDRLADADPRVRQKAHESLARLTGQGCFDNAQACYRDLARARGWLR